MHRSCHPRPEITIGADHQHSHFIHQIRSVLILVNPFSPGVLDPRPN